MERPGSAFSALGAAYGQDLGPGHIMGAHARRGAIYDNLALPSPQAASQHLGWGLLPLSKIHPHYSHSDSCLLAPDGGHTQIPLEGSSGIPIRNLTGLNPTGDRQGYAWSGEKEEIDRAKQG